MDNDADNADDRHFTDFTDHRDAQYFVRTSNNCYKLVARDRNSVSQER